MWYIRTNNYLTFWRHRNTTCFTILRLFRIFRKLVLSIKLYLKRRVDFIQQHLILISAYCKREIPIRVHPTLRNSLELHNLINLNFARILREILIIIFHVLEREFHFIYLIKRVFQILFDAHIIDLVFRDIHLRFYHPEKFIIFYEDELLFS